MSVRIVHEPHGDNDPDYVHKNEVNPKEERVRRVQTRAASEPLGAERHPTAVELSRAEYDDPIMPRGIAPHDLIHDEGSHGAGTEHGEQLEGDDGRVGRAPACVCSGVFAPHLGKGTRGGIHGAPERGQGEEGAFEDEVDERIECKPDEGGAVLPWRVFGEECPCRGRRDERNGRDASEGVR